MTNASDRLKHAREAAGFASAQDAVARFGWKYPTYGAHENGTRGMKPDAITRYARAFRVDESWIQFGRGSGPDSSKPPTPRPTVDDAPGFSEPVAAPFVASSSTEKLAFEALAARLVPNAKSTALFKLNATLLDFGLLRDDILIVDMNPRLRDGQLTLINVADPEIGAAHTAICRNFSPHLVYSAGETRELPPQMRTDTVAILGEIRASFRPDST